MFNCPVCNSSALAEKSVQKDFASNGRTLTFPYLFSVCGKCAAEIVSEDQSIENKKQKRAAFKEANGHLSGSEIGSVRQKYRLTQSQAAQIFGGGPVAFSKYESETIMPSEAMNTLLVVAQNFPQVVSFLAERIGFKWTSVQWGEQENPGAMAAYARSPRYELSEHFITNVVAAFAAGGVAAKQVGYSFSRNAANDELSQSAA